MRGLIIFIIFFISSCLCFNNRVIISEEVQIEAIKVTDQRCNETNGNQYMDHWNDTTKFVKCDSVGLAIEFSCDQLLDNMTWISCTKNVTNGTDEVKTRVQKSFGKVFVFNSLVSSRNSLIKSSCDVNCVHGVCDEFSNSSQCICLVRFTGDKCEIPIAFNSSNLVEEIFNQTSSENVTNYQNFVQSLLNNTWSAICPESEYMHNSTHNNVLNGSNIGLTIQKMKLYNEHIYDHFHHSFSTY